MQPSTLSLLIGFGLIAFLRPAAHAQLTDNYQQTAKELGSQIIKKQLPADLPQAKILFIRSVPVGLPAERPADMKQAAYTRRKWHNQNCGWSNAQLEQAAQKYPFAYRITTQDSVEYYHNQGYKYLLFHDAFNSFVMNSYHDGKVFNPDRGLQGTTQYYAPTADLYVQDLSTNDFYVIGEFKRLEFYKYGQIMPLLTKKVHKTFPAKS